MRPDPCPGGMGIKDGRGYGPYGRGYYHRGPGPNDYAPFGPNCERLPPSREWDAQHQLGGAPMMGLNLFGEPQTAEEYTRQRNTYNLLMAGLLGVSGLLLVWALYPKKRR